MFSRSIDCSLLPYGFAGHGNKSIGLFLIVNRLSVYAIPAWGNSMKHIRTVNTLELALLGIGTLAKLAMVLT